MSPIDSPLTASEMPNWISSHIGRSLGIVRREVIRAVVAENQDSAVAEHQASAAPPAPGVFDTLDPEDRPRDDGWRMGEQYRPHGDVLHAARRPAGGGGAMS